MQSTLFGTFEKTGNYSIDALLVLSEWLLNRIPII